MIARRGFLTTLLAAPAIIRTPGLLMPVKPVLWATDGLHLASLDSIARFMTLAMLEQENILIATVTASVRAHMADTAFIWRSEFPLAPAASPP